MVKMKVLAIILHRKLTLWVEISSFGKLVLSSGIGGVIGTGIYRLDNDRELDSTGACTSRERHIPTLSVS